MENPGSNTLMRSEWLPIIMLGSFSEIYVMDCRNLRFVQVNEVAQINLQYSANELSNLTLLDIADGLTPDALEQTLFPLRHHAATQVTLDAAHIRKDGSRYPIEFRLFLAAPDTAPVFIAIGNDVSRQQESAEALDVSESRFKAMVSNTPGLFYQFILQQNGTMSFPYLSEGCLALLGISADQLRVNPHLFLDLILQEDRSSYLDSMSASASDLKNWNWEGRIWVDAWKDIKWINLRSTPRKIADGNVKWEGLMTNITQSKMEEIEIKQSKARLTELSAHIERIKEQERTRIAREIHDDLGGNLTAIKMALAMLTRRMPAEDLVLAEKTTYVDLLVDRTIEAAHRISRDLRPSILDFGVVAALEWQTKEFEKQVGIPCIFSSNKKDIALHLDQATAIFRIFQEALTNIAKHAHATNVAVKLACNKGAVSLKITDNGRGITASNRHKSQSFGIRGMIERANALGGTLTIAHPRVGGSIVSIKIPLSDVPLLPHPDDIS